MPPPFLHKGISDFPCHRRRQHAERHVPILTVRLCRSKRERRLQPRLYHRERRRLLAEQRLRLSRAAVAAAVSAVRRILYPELYHPKYHRADILQLARLPARRQLPDRRRFRRPGDVPVRENIRV